MGKLLQRLNMLMRAHKQMCARRQVYPIIRAKRVGSIQDGDKMALLESGEMYLKAILVLSKKGSAVRRVDIGEYLGYSKPSVTRAIGLLEKQALVTSDEDGCLSLTEEGQKAAERIYEHHKVLTDLFVRLGVSEETAAEDACRIEHCISDETFAAIKKHMQEYGAMK